MRLPAKPLLASTPNIMDLGLTTTLTMTLVPAHANKRSRQRLRAHKHFRAKVFEGPRTAWAFDFHGVAASDEGYREVLGGIDLVTGVLRLFATKDRSAAITTDCILQGVILRDGVSLVIHSDHAREFISKLLSTLEKALGITATTTLTHHPTGNSKIERV